MSDLAAIILAGGRGSRMGGAAKPLLELDGRTLLARVADAARLSGAAPVVVVGPDAGDAEGVALVREEPPYGGPVAGIAAALAGISSERTLLLAADLVLPTAITERLVAALPGPDGVVLVDPDGREQWLAGIYRTAAIAERLAGLGDPSGAAVRQLLTGLDLARAPATAPEVADIDTWEDFERLTGEEH